MNLSPLALTCSRILLVPGGVHYLPCGCGLLDQFFSFKWREDFTTGIEPPTTPFGNGYLSTITQWFRVISDLPNTTYPSSHAGYGSGQECLSPATLILSQDYFVQHQKNSLLPIAKVQKLYAKVYRVFPLLDLVSSKGTLWPMCLAICKQNT